MPAGSEPDAPRAPSAPLPLRFPLGGCCVGVGALTERKSTFSLATVMTLILLYQNLILVRHGVLGPTSERWRRKCLFRRRSTCARLYFDGR